MTTWGLATQSGNGTINMDSRVMNGIFYNNNGFYSSTATIPSTGFRLQYSIATPVTTPTYFWNGDQSNYSAAITASGTVFEDGKQYIAPAAINNSDNCFNYLPSVTPLTSQIYSFGTPFLGGAPWGFFAFGSNPGGTANFAVAQTRKAYYVHPGPNGQALRTATCSSIPSSFAATIGTYNVPNELPGQTIYFERTFVNPPLIFVTQSTGPVSLHYMTRDGSGQYNGMVVVAASSFSTQGNAGSSWYTSNTYSFTYFIISDEVPIYVAPSNFGLKVFNEFGSNIFDSSYFCATFTSFLTRRPWLVLQGWYRLPSCSNVGTAVYSQIGEVNLTKTALQGVCLNNINSLVGHTTLTSLFLGSQGTSSGPTTFVGHFANVTSTNVNISAIGTNGVFMNPTYPAPGWANSWEYYPHRQFTTWLMANYAY